MADIPINMNIPMIEQAKIQARVLVPVVKAFQAELGEERANQIVRKALDSVSRQTGQAIDFLFAGTPAEKIAAAFPIIAAGDALDIEIIKQTSDAFECNVTGCRYADFFRQLGEPELGFLFHCSDDFALTKALSPDLEFTCTQTIMQGAGHCDPRFRLRKGRA
jgi:hypothetical protein